MLERATGTSRFRSITGRSIGMRSMSVIRCLMFLNEHAGAGLPEEIREISERAVPRSGENRLAK